MEHKIELTFGYTDKEGRVHREVVFGKRLRLNDLMRLDMNPLAQLPTQYERLVIRTLITEFGKLSVPVDLTVMLALDTLDDDKLAAAADEFLVMSREGRSGEFRQDEALLAFGIELDGDTFDTVRFGNRLTVNDYAEADRMNLKGVARAAYLVGRQISEITGSEHGRKRDGQLTVDQLSTMDSEDFKILRLAAEFFRLEVAGMRAKGESPNHDDSADSKEDGAIGEPSRAAAGGEV